MFQDGPLTLKINKMKTYVLTVSKTFPKTHKRAGEETGFIDKIKGGVKLHTIRANYELWKKRAEEINSGNAILSLRYWSGNPYRSKQIEFAQLDEIEVQALIFPEKTLLSATACGPEYPNPTWYFGVNIGELAKNDGLSVADFVEWFRKYDLSKPMAIIHFTDFKY